MGLIETLILLYAALVVGGWVMTYREYRAKGSVHTVFAVAGLLACTVWPVILLVLILTARRSQTAEPPAFGGRALSGGAEGMSAPLALTGGGDSPGALRAFPSA